MKKQANRTLPDDEWNELQTHLNGGLSLAPLLIASFVGVCWFFIGVAVGKWFF